MNNVVISILGQRLDNVGYGQKRWFRWRPTMSLLMHHDFQVDELVLLYQKDETKLLEQTMSDAQELCLNIKITPYEVMYEDPWDFEQVYNQLHGFADSYSFNREQNNYFFHITTGTHVAQICFYLLTDLITSPES